MAQLFFSANASRDLFDAAAKMVGHRRGGLAYASIGGCAGFGAINGSSLATAATIGMVALPEMRSRGYSDALATGTVAAGGTLGQMIPPSGALIVFGIIAEQSIGQLFTAAIMPGIIAGAVLCGGDLRGSALETASRPRQRARAVGRAAARAGADRRHAAAHRCW